MRQSEYFSRRACLSVPCFSCYISSCTAHLPAAIFRSKQCILCSEKFFISCLLSPPMLKNELTQFSDGNATEWEWVWGWQGGRKGGGGGSQELNHSHVSNLRLFFFFLPKSMNQIKLVLLWMKEEEYNSVNQSNYQICGAHWKLIITTAFSHTAARRCLRASVNIMLYKNS